MPIPIAPPETLVSLEDLRHAATVLRGVAVRTPLLPFDALSERIGAAAYLKPEMLQRGGAFKLRGAYHYVAALSPEARGRGIVAPSSGNHAQACALAARLFGIPCTVVMPTTVPAAKRDGAIGYGARVELAGTTTADRMRRAEELVRDEGVTLVPPYDDPMIIAGQGTAGLEIAEDLPAVRTVVVPVGGGGLSAGVATAIKLLVPEARVVGVEPVGAPKLTTARRAGHPVVLESTGGLADGLLAVAVGDAPFRHHQAYLDDVVMVPDDALRPAMRLLLDRAKLVAEPSGAIAVAALLEGIVRVEGPTVAVLSGGNIEWAGLTALLGGAPA
ncbi:MAG: pyridoxal-phosphate dependent enzyme [Gemmatimonadaceae bacterium]|nr:pyridoxal-phosphate dependent enzyme [Gemmatimonadaceae bacterium]